MEGKAKLKIVIDKLYKSSDALLTSLFESEATDDLDVDDICGDDSCFDDLPLDNDLVNDIAALGAEEQKMLRQAADPDADDADADPAPSEPDSKVSLVEVVAVIPVVDSSSGASEGDAIALSDDEEEDNTSAQPPTLSNPVTSDSRPLFKAEEHMSIGTAAPIASLQLNRLQHDTARLLNDSRLYRMFFRDTSFGMETTVVDGRIVISRIGSERVARLGLHAKPSVGDILVSIDNQSLCIQSSADAYMQYLKARLQNPPVELIFIEAPRFIELFRRGAFTNVPGLQPVSTAPWNNSAAGADDVIDLLVDE